VTILSGVSESLIEPALLKGAGFTCAGNAAEIKNAL